MNHEYLWSKTGNDAEVDSVSAGPGSSTSIVGRAGVGASTGATRSITVLRSCVSSRIELPVPVEQGRCHDLRGRDRLGFP